MKGAAAVIARLRSGLVRCLSALPRPILRALVGRPVHVDGQLLHVEAQLTLRLLALDRAPALQRLSAPAARQRVLTDALTFAGRTIELDRVEELTITGAAGPLEARLYVPGDLDTATGLVVYFHGGGFVVGDLDTHDNACRFFAQRSGTPMLAVDYRLAPEHPFPAAIDDALAAFEFAVEHAAGFGADPERIAVAGDSAGGNLAAGVARLASAQGGTGPALQLLFYPWLDLHGKRESYRLFGEGFYLTEEDLEWYSGHYLPEPGAALDPRCSPLLAEDLAGVAPAYIATAGFDPLRDDGEAYARRLREAGVPVALRRHSGLLHAFFNTVSLGHAAREAVLEAAGAVRIGLARAR